MPELPDITLYVEALEARILDRSLIRARAFSPFVLRTAVPALTSLEGRVVVCVRRIGKRIAIQFAGGSWLVIHLMIAGRLLWQPGEPKLLRPGGKSTQAMLVFPEGHLLLTEAGSKHRASLHVLAGDEDLAALDPGGLEPLRCSLEQFAECLRRENRTMKRALTQPRMLSGIGNAYSDEILHAARLSPLKLTSALSDDEIERLFWAMKEVLHHWTDTLRNELKGKFPGKGQVTAFRPDFAAHGKFGQPCPDCAKPIQRIRYAENETNYCAVCQNEGRLLADRALSRILKDDWPRTLEELIGE